MTSVQPETAATPTRDESPAAASGAPAAPIKSGTTFETLAVCGFIFGVFSIAIAVFALGLAVRAVDEAGTGGGTSVTPAASDAAESTLEVSLKDFAIDPGDVSVEAGAVLNLSNDGGVTHNLSVDGVASDMIDPGAAGELDLGKLEPGTYTMVCDVAGHEAAGMKGTLTIE